MSTQIRGVKADFDQTNAVDAKPSASVILMRDSTNGPEIFMLKRNEGLSFSPGLWVFPGGALDPEEVAEISSNDKERSENAFKLAALRETFEESRVLLANHGDTKQAISSSSYEDFCRQQDWPKLPQQFNLIAELAQFNWQLNLGALTHLSTWTTPLQAKKRFLTRFYVARMPQGQSASCDGSETVEARWQSLTALKSEIDQGDLKLMFPTEMNISWLSQFGSLAELDAALINHVAPSVMPRMEKHPEGVMLNIPIEAGYGISQRLMRL